MNTVTPWICGITVEAGVETICAQEVEGGCPLKFVAMNHYGIAGNLPLVKFTRNNVGLRLEDGPVVCAVQYDNHFGLAAILDGEAGYSDGVSRSNNQVNKQVEHYFDHSVSSIKRCNVVMQEDKDLDPNAMLGVKSGGKKRKKESGELWSCGFMVVAKVWFMKRGCKFAQLNDLKFNNNSIVQWLHRLLGEDNFLEPPPLIELDPSQYVRVFNPRLKPLLKTIKLKRDPPLKKHPKPISKKASGW